MGFRYTGSAAADAAVSDHEAAGDPHPQYPLAGAVTAAVAAAVAAHETAGDPHTGYVTDAALTAHEAASDPHPGYQREGQTISTVGFFGAAVTGARPAVTGSRGGNAALASLLGVLAGLGLITDNTTA